MAQRAQTSPAQVAQTIAATPFPLEAMILQQPAAASAALSADPTLAATLIETSDPTIAPPPRIIYRLIMADPTLAANILITLDQQGKTRLATESLAYLAYDKTRSAQYPQLPISLTQDGKFLNSLLEQQGPKWLTTRLTNAVTLYRQRTNAAEAPPNFLPQYRQTLQAAANTQPPQTATRLHQNNPSRLHLTRPPLPAHHCPPVIRSPPLAARHSEQLSVILSKAKNPHHRPPDPPLSLRPPNLSF